MTIASRTVDDMSRQGSGTPTRLDAVPAAVDQPASQAASQPSSQSASQQGKASIEKGGCRVLISSRRRPLSCASPFSVAAKPGG